MHVFVVKQSQIDLTSEREGKTKKLSSGGTCLHVIPRLDLGSRMTSFGISAIACMPSETHVLRRAFELEASLSMDVFIYLQAREFFRFLSGLEMSF